jgi:ribosome-binding factor A
MSNRRLARLNEQLRREVSDIIRVHVRDPDVGRPTVTEVDVTPDLWMARVYVRPDPTLESSSTEVMLEGLGRAAPYIRRELGKSLRVRRVPELRFEADSTLENALRIEQILREVLPGPGSSEDEGAKGKDPAGESDPMESKGGEKPDHEEEGRS